MQYCFFNAKSIKETSLNKKSTTVKPYETIKKMGYILGQDYTVEILLLLSYEPHRNKQLKTILKCKDNTLARRLRYLQRYGIIDKLPVTLGNQKSHEYTITELGQELIKFFRNFERKQNSGGK